MKEKATPMKAKLINKKKRFKVKSICIILFALILIPITKTQAQTEIPEGSVSGIWTVSGSPYNINGDITVANGTTLTIEPGVSVMFQGHYKLNVQGRLLAIGTSSLNITFTAQNTVEGWGGMRFDMTSEDNDTSKISYCNFSYGNATGSDWPDYNGGALYVRVFSKLIVSDCLFENNTATGEGGGAVYLFNGSRAIFKNNVFADNYAYRGGAIYMQLYSDATLINNIIANNSADYGGGVAVFASNPRLINNVIVNNSGINGGGLIYEKASAGRLANNTIANNLAFKGGGIYLTEISNPVFVNTILWGDSAVTSGDQVYINEGCQPTFHNCDIDSGTVDFGGETFSGIEMNCEDLNPQFNSPSVGKGDSYGGVSANWHLQSGSPCIDSGAVWSRMDNDATTSDIGAYTTVDWAGTGDLPVGSIGGNMSGTVTNNCIIADDVIIYEDDSLTIDPGVELSGVADIIVFGNLIAVGDTNDTIVFTGLNDGWWGGINYYIDASSLNELTFCDISLASSCGIYCGKNENNSAGSINILDSKIHHNLGYQGGGIFSEQYQQLFVVSCMLEYNQALREGGGIYSTSTITGVTKSIIKNNYSEIGGGLFCSSMPAYIYYNMFTSNASDNGGGVYLNGCGNGSFLISNLIYNNYATNSGGGVFINNSSHSIANNTIIDNNADNFGGGLYYAYDSDPTHNNDIIFYNESPNGTQVYLLDSASNPNFYYCDISGDSTDFESPDTVIFKGDYLNNIDQNPYFTYSGNHPYELSDTSPCINAGNPDHAIAGLKGERTNN